MYDKFIHLHCFSEYSVVASINTIKKLIGRAKALGMQSLAITDINNLFALVKFYQACKQAKIKPIIGADVSLYSATLKQNYRLILLCQNSDGFRNLTKIITHAYETKINDNLFVDEEFFIRHSAGLIIITHPHYSDISLHINLNDQEEASIKAKYWQDLFGCRYYFGIARINRIGEIQTNNKLLSIAKQLAMPVVAMNEICFIENDDFEAHEARVCINQSVTLDNPHRDKIYTNQQYFKSQEEIGFLFKDIPSAIQNSIEISKKCNLEMSFGDVFLPTYPIPNNISSADYLKQQSFDGLYKRFAEDLNVIDQNVYIDRLNLELLVINNMGFAGYFLIVADFINWAMSNGVPVGPGRGSGAGSLVAYALRITNIDPLKYDLLFERFLNPERVSMPDFDIDFCMDGRDRVIDYVIHKYGVDSVAQIITYGTMAAKAVIRDVGRVLGYGYNFVDKIAKLIPLELGITLSKALEDEPNLALAYKEDEDVKVLIDLALKLEGITRNVGKHAGGVVIAPRALVNFTPLYYESNDAQPVTQLDKNDVEYIGLVKFDFLGLRTLTIIDWAIKNIKQHTGQQINIDLIPLNDAKTFHLLQSMRTTAIFQLESRGMKDLIGRLIPDCFEDIIALVALFRPGPLQSGMVDDFIDRKLGRAKILYPHQDLEPILRPTYGVILYQEQVMQIAQVLAGYTLGAADLLRRAMGKKKPEEMAKQREIFENGAVNRGVDADTARYIFDLMEKFAGYGFNKSHSAAYALISYQTAWLKAHYPADFMAAVLSADMSNTDKIVLLIKDCIAEGIEILPPSINLSDNKFIVKENRVIHGLGAIKGLGINAIQEIIAIREKQGEFNSLYELCQRCCIKKVNKKALEVLILSGALDCFKIERASMFASIADALKSGDQLQSNKMKGQTDLFANILSDVELYKYADVLPWTLDELLRGEKSTLGIYISGHPIDQYRKELSSIINSDLKSLQPKPKVKQMIAGIIVGARTMMSKRGDKLAFITIDDDTYQQEVMILPDLLNKYKDLLVKDQLIILSVDVTKDNFSGGVKTKALDLYNLNNYRANNVKNILLTIKQKNVDIRTLMTRLNVKKNTQEQQLPNIFINYRIDNIFIKIRLNTEFGFIFNSNLKDELRADFGEHVDIKYIY